MFADLVPDCPTGGEQNFRYSRISLTVGNFYRVTLAFIDSLICMYSSNCIFRFCFELCGMRWSSIIVFTAVMWHICREIRERLFTRYFPLFPLSSIISSFVFGTSSYYRSSLMISFLIDGSDRHIANWSQLLLSPLRLFPKLLRASVKDFDCSYSMQRPPWP